MSRLLRLSALAALAYSSVAIAGVGRYTLIGWNDLGMHCMDGDYSVFSILPPYNTIHAQLIDGSGHLVKSGSGVRLTYESLRDSSGSINTTSSWKTRFWDFTGMLFGAQPAADKGLAGFSMPGPENSPQQMRFDADQLWFTAEGIPITNWDDAGNRNPYPMMRLTARDSSGNLLATTDVVLPVSDEMDCRTCHASGSRPETKPANGWANDWHIERDYKRNILALHDDHQHTNLRAGAEAGTPVLCASCHSTNALGAKGVAGISSLTKAMHGLHAEVADPVSGLTLSSDQNRSACYRCHPGSETRCLRGAMGNSVATDGTMAMQCQSCHGSMTAVGSERQGWLDEPNCQSCHTGTAVSNRGQIRFTSSFVSPGQMRQPADSIFATNANTPAAGISLYRFSAGHGGLKCEACHGSTHAEYPALHGNDNVQSIGLQGHAGTISECTVCHSEPSRQQWDRGPHGLHPVGQNWVRNHGDEAEDGRQTACRACHGDDYSGTVLSRATADRTLTTEWGTKQIWRGQLIGCYLCHDGPDSESRSRSIPPSVSADAVSGEVGNPITVTLRSNAAATFRIVNQPQGGTVSINGSTATYRPFAGFEGDDSFTFAGWSSRVDSNLGRVAVRVSAQQRPSLAAVVNGASYQSGAVAPGEMVTIFGTRLGPDQPKLFEINSAGLLARSLEGTRVLFDGAPAALIHTTAQQVTAMVPYSVAGKSTTRVEVEYGGIRSSPVEVQVAASAPGIFSANQNGSGPGAILNYANGSYVLNSGANPAPRDSFISLFATGEGNLDRTMIDGQLAGSSTPKPLLPVKVRIGGVEAVVLFAGTAPFNTAGFLQVNVQIPREVVPGDAVPVVLQIGDATSQPGITMAVK